MSKTVIIHGVRITKELVSPRAGREHADLWGLTRCNQKYWGGRLTDWTEWFDMHPLESSGEWVGIHERRPEAWAWYREQTPERPIWMAKHSHQIAASRVFPVDELRNAFPVLEDLEKGPEPCRQFTCMLDLVIAFALLRGYETIILNGIGFATDAGHQYVHRGILYWIGFARGRGQTVLVDAPSVYRMPQQIYGYERFGFDELRDIRKALSQAEIDARRRGRPAPTRRHRR